jgi:hypothetical protein
MPVDCGVPVVTMLVCAFYHCTRGYGCELRTRHSLRPLLPEGLKLGRDPRRENAGAWRKSSPRKRHFVELGKLITSATSAQMKDSERV